MIWLLRSSILCNFNRFGKFSRETISHSFRDKVRSSGYPSRALTSSGVNFPIWALSNHNSSTSSFFMSLVYSSINSKILKLILRGCTFIQLRICLWFSWRTIWNNFVKKIFGFKSYLLQFSLSRFFVYYFPQAFFYLIRSCDLSKINQISTIFQNIREIILINFIELWLK